jgi:hypothetical protein
MCLSFSPFFFKFYQFLFRLPPFLSCLLFYLLFHCLRLLYLSMTSFPGIIQLLENLGFLDR